MAAGHLPAPSSRAPEAVEFAPVAWPPDYVGEIMVRQRRLRRLKADERLRAGWAERYRDDPASWIAHWAVTYDPRNAAGDLPTVIPFVPFARQIEMIAFLKACVDGQQHGLIEKARDMGATWIACAFSVWLWLYRPGAAVGWGRGRMKCNLMWYGAFTATAHTTKTGGKGLGGGSKNTTYTYTASIMMGICEGGASGIQGIRTIYKDTAVLTSMSAAGLSLATGTPTQPVWSYLTSKFPAQAIPYSGIAYVYAQDYDLADSATLPNHSFEIDFATQLGGGVPDADPKDVITDFLTNPAYGVPMWGSGLIGDLSDYSLYCRANNLLLSPVLESQSSAASILEEWLTATNSAAFWSEGMLKIRPYGDAAATGNGVTWNPTLTPAYDLTEDDLIVDDSGNAVSIEIVDQSDAYNIVQFEFLDRSNRYNVGIATAQDLDNIVTYGRRKQDPTTVHCICDAAIARQAVQLYGQRVLYTREKYTFKLPWNFALLEPTDLVTLTTATDALLLNRQLVRITEIEEDGDGLLAITAEGVPVGVASAAQYASHSASGYAPNTDVAPGALSTPVLFNAPTSLTGGDGQLWCAVASTSPTWGGCEVWASADGVDYARFGVIEGPARYGTLTAALPGHADPDATNTLSVDLTSSNGTLDSATAAAADAGGSLCLVEDEIVTYEGASLTGANRYDLTTLHRGFLGTAPASHATGTRFVRLDEAIFKLSYSSPNVGSTIYVKLPSFNVFGRALEDRSHTLPAGGADRNQRPLLHLRRQFLGREAENAGAGGRERVPVGQARALPVELGAIDRSHRRIAAKHRPAVVRVLPRPERAEHLRRERLVDFVEIEVLQCQAGAGQHAADRNGRRHQKAVAMREIVGRHLPVGQVGENGQVVHARPFLARQQHR